MPAFSLLSAATLPPPAVLLHPGLLTLGAALAAVPVLIHLWSRRRVRRVDWAAMVWLLAALKRHQRRLRMENWLVLLLRVAALVLLGLGLSRLVLTDSTIAILAQPKRSVVLLLDTSYSTAARDGARAVSDRVRLEADRVLSSLGSDDAMAVVVSNDVRLDRAGTHPAVLVARTVGREGVAKSKEALGRLRPTEAPARWAEAVAAAAPKALLGPDDVNRALVWITDLQAVDWAPPPPGKTDPLHAALEELAREKIEIAVIDVGGSGARSLPNLSIAALSTDSASAGKAQAKEGATLFQGHGFRLAVRVENHGDKPVTGASLRVFLDDATAPVHPVRLETIPAADPVTLQPGSREEHVEVDRALSFKTPGPHSLRVELGPPEGDSSADALGLDSRRYLALDVRATLKVLAWVERGATAKVDPVTYLRGVFTGEGGGDVFQLRAASGEDDFRRQLATYEPDLVILANRVPGGVEAQRELIGWVRGGGALIAFAGDRFDAATWNAAFATRKEATLVPFQFGPRQVRARTDSSKDAWRFDLEAATPHPLSKAWLGDPGVREWLTRIPPKAWGRMPFVPVETPSPRPVTPTDAAPAGEEAVVLWFARDPDSPAAPAVVEAPFGQGRTMWVATSLDDDWLDANATVFFLPVLLNDSALLLTARGGTQRNLLVGRPIQGAIPRDASGVRLAVPGRQEEIPTVRAATDESSRPEVLYDRVGTSGIWRLSYDRAPVRGREPKRTEELFAVDVDPQESSLQRFGADRLVARAAPVVLKVVSTYAAPQATAKEGSTGEVTPWVLGLVAALLLLEPWLAMRFGRHGHTKTPKTGAA